MILTGEGRAFSAGGDLKELLSERVSGTYPEWPELMLEAREIILSILDCRQPIIAKVNDAAILWPQLIGFHRAKQYLLTGEPLTGKKAALPPRANASTKRAINLPLLREAVSSMDASLGLETTARLSEDHLEALTAIVEKRPGTFVGR